MSNTTTVIFFGPGDSHSQPSPHLKTLDGSTKPLREVDSDELRELLTAVDTPLVTCIERGSHASEKAIARLSDALVSDPQKSCGIAVGGRLANFWLKTSPRLAAIVTPPEEAGILVVPTESLRGDGLREVNHPLWDWLIRTTAASRPVEIQTSAGLVENGRPRPELTPQEPDEDWEWLRNHIFLADPKHLAPELTSLHDAMALKAGLFQILGFLDDSHTQSQRIQHEGRHAAADYWHGIMHRREPDYSNAKYWFRHTGRHPIFESLGDIAHDILEECSSRMASVWLSRLLTDGEWNPFEFVEMCAEAESLGDDELLSATEELQWEEMLLLLESNYADAVGAA